jgi:hypothetical protein
MKFRHICNDCFTQTNEGKFQNGVFKCRECMEEVIKNESENNGSKEKVLSTV